MADIEKGGVQLQFRFRLFFFFFFWVNRPPAKCHPDDPPAKEEGRSDRAIYPIVYKSILFYIIDMFFSIYLN